MSNAIEPRLPGADCQNCPLAQYPYNGPVRGDYAPGTRVVFIGDAPGNDEVQTGVAYTGPTGQLLRDITNKYNHESFNAVGYTNLVACQPPNGREPTQQEIECCSGRLTIETSQYAPEADRYVAMGSTAVQYLTGEKVSETEGTWYYKKGLWVMRCLQPAIILHSPESYDAVSFAVVKALNSTPQELHIPDVAYHVIESIDELPWDFPGYLAMDIETNGLDHTASNAKINCVAVAWDTDNALIVPQHLVYTQEFTDWLNTTADHSTIVMQHGKFDYRWLMTHVGCKYGLGVDTLLVHYAMRPNGLGSYKARGKEEASGGHGLKLMLRKYRNIGDYKIDIDKMTNPQTEQEWQDLYFYNAVDTCEMLALFMENLDYNEDSRVFHQVHDVMMPTTRALCRMETAGIPLDVVHLASALDVIQAEIDGYVTDLQGMTYPKFNPRSHVQVKKVLYEREQLGLPEQYKDGKLTSNAEALEYLASLEGTVDTLAGMFLNRMLAHRKAEKFRGTYLQGLLNGVSADGRIRTTFNQHGTDTGRLSSSKPVNLQNQPRANTPWGKLIRDAFVPEPGHVWVSIDAAQVELRMLAILADDEPLKQAFLNGVDLHTETARAAVRGYDDLPDALRDELRTKVGKGINFGIAYGMQADTLADAANVSVWEAQEWLDNYFRVHPNVKQWQQDTVESAFRSRVMESKFGFRWEIPYIPKNDQSALIHLRNKIMNRPIQHAASVAILVALGRVSDNIYNRGMGEFIIPLLTVHDSVDFSCHPNFVAWLAVTMQETFTDVVTEYFDADIPFLMDTKVGERWGSLIKLSDWRARQSTETTLPQGVIPHG